MDELMNGCVSRRRGYVWGDSLMLILMIVQDDTPMSEAELPRPPREGGGWFLGFR